jgi:hypothetical protein
MANPYEKAKKLSKIEKDKRKDPEYRKKQAENMREVALKQWQDPEYRRKQLSDREYRHKDKKFMKKMNKLNKNKFKDNDIVRDKISETQKKNFKDPKRRAQHTKMTRDTAEVRSDKMKANWDRPSFVYKVMKHRYNHERALDFIERKFGLEQRTECEARLEQ